ncbi:MAG TPA: methionyl-tRNA formyltransferase [Thermodesulfobacteriota bacterium]|nr:methionyl-tRNA formyltransferase [Thermodesulfobacteriota bacterium]
MQEGSFRILFMGTSPFAAPCLKILLAKGENVVGVFTQPDRPQGRGLKIKTSLIKGLALENYLPLFQPVKINHDESVTIIKSLFPDIIVVAAFGQIISPRILDIPRFGCINVHASLLPKYRGAAPINWVIINGEKETGITTMLMDKGLDTGDILVQRKLEIFPEENAGQLHDRLSFLGAEVLLETIDRLKQGRLTSSKQEESEASYAPPMKKEDGVIDWEKSAEKIYNHIRGMNPWPGAFTYLEGKILKVFQAKHVLQGPPSVPGKVVKTSDEGILIGAGEGHVLLTEVQLENHKRMPAAVFLRGHPLNIGTRLG